MEFDKGLIEHMLGRRITGVAFKRRKPDVKNLVNNVLYFMFDDGTGMEIVCTGELIPCNQPEAFDLHRAAQRGSNAYDNEFLGIANPDGAGHAVLINTPLEI
ncbi:MAG TPA: hypothetical protein VFX02_14075 [Gammaproteobacteria bacterium]|nr:hypothetical protein [Gammaproteobacteria bacterium]